MTVTPITDRNFPADPNATELRSAYTALRRAAQAMSRSRGQYIRQVRERDEQISRMQADFTAFAENAQLDLEERAKLLGIVQSYRDVFSAMETVGDDLVDGLKDYETGAGPYYGARPLGQLLKSARAFVAAWKQIKSSITAIKALPGI